MSDNVVERIKSELAEKKILLFMKGTPDFPQCGFSAATVELLRSFPYHFDTIDVIENQDIREKLPEMSNWPTFPQLFVNGKLVGGCDIVHELHGTGELAKILEEAFVS